ncbi:MAG: LacI family DNA-binding transcriptional regulator [Spirochaetaceae bacterium]
MARVTINDIARISGYSKTSVSFAFNDPGRISEKARERILAIAEELGYIPDPVARNLTLRRHGTIGLLLPETISVAFLNSHLSQIVQGIGEVCEREGHSLTLIPPVRESVLEGVRSAAVDGLITVGLEPGMETVELIRQRHLPFVTIDGRVGGGFPVVGIDDRHAAAAIMRYLLQLHHRFLAVICFVDEPQLAGPSQVKGERLAGYRDGLTEEAPEAQVRFYESESSITGGREIAEEILDAPDRPTAIVAMSDVIALGVLEHLAARGVSVPEEISVVGFDDIPEARLVRPQLTTVSQHGFEKGQTAANLLMRLIAKESAEGHIVLDSKLVIRESSAKPSGTFLPSGG